jgi:hypothetical protein
MKKNQLKLLTAPILLFVLLALNACTKTDLKSPAAPLASTAAIGIVNSDAIPGAARGDGNEDKDDRDDNDGSHGDGDDDRDDHNQMKSIIFASTNGSFLEDGKNSRFNFFAVKRTNSGRAYGQVRYQYTAGGFTIIGRVRNLVVGGTPSSKAAKVYGVITRVQGTVPPAFSFVQPGKKFLFNVQDNNDNQPVHGPDLISDFVVYTNTTAIDPPPIYVVKGHVEVGRRP